MWIGLLWYFNFVQIPNMAIIPDAQKPAKGKVIAYGAPTDPGNLLMYGTLKNKKIITVRVGKKSFKING